MSDMDAKMTKRVGRCFFYYYYFFFRASLFALAVGPE